VLEFIEQVKTISNGSINIEPIWQAGDTTDAGFEIGVIQLVGAGEAELGLAGSRSFDNENVMSFQVLQAPFLITNDALSKAVATSDISVRMLQNLSSVGLTGLTMWPEDLRHPFSLLPDKPIFSPEDFAGLNVRATPSRLTYTLIETLGGKPMFGDDGYEGAESGLRQGASLTGTPVATGNVIFFPKFQVLFANSIAFEKLSDDQRSILRDAAAATQQKAISEHLGDVEAGAAWCADGGSIVMASDEQIAAFEAAAKPVFDQIEQDPLNAELIAAIRELKENTEPSPGAEACTS
jgi:TRAP-type C4-dicarboxylate transport system substrate-binding protein